MIDISIIISTYKRSFYLEKLLSSITSQKFDLKKVEVIIISDTDDSKEQRKEKKLISQYKNKFGNLIYIQNEKRKLTAHNFNLGISLAKGKYILILDDDEELVDPLFLKTMIEEYREIKDKSSFIFLISPVFSPHSLIVPLIKTPFFPDFYSIKALIKYLLIKIININKQVLLNWKIKDIKKLNKVIKILREKKFKYIKVDLNPFGLHFPVLFCKDYKIKFFEKIFPFHHTDSFLIYYLRKKGKKVKIKFALKTFCVHYIKTGLRSLRAKDPFIYYHVIRADIKYYMFIKRTPVHFLIWLIPYLIRQYFNLIRFHAKKEVREAFFRALKEAIFE